jgi:hypothetical protein
MVNKPEIQTIVTMEPEAVPTITACREKQKHHWGRRVSEIETDHHVATPTMA